MANKFPSTLTGMHIGIIVLDDLDYGPDLANSFIESDLSVTLYLSEKVASLYMWGRMKQPDEIDTNYLIEQLYERSLVPRSCRIRLVKFPRVRDLRSLAVARRLKRMIQTDEVDIVHILMGDRKSVV